MPVHIQYTAGHLESRKKDAKLYSASDIKTILFCYEDKKRAGLHGTELYSSTLRLMDGLRCDSGHVCQPNWGAHITL